MSGAMAVNELTKHFQVFLSNINPPTTYEQIASREYKSIKSLLENIEGPAGAIMPVCFLQGSYKQDTAIHTINDIDIVALCSLLSQPISNGDTRRWTRNQIFDTLASAISRDSRYKDKIRYNDHSICVKVDLEIKVEILPAVKKAGTPITDIEPFRIYKPDLKSFVDAYAREHQKRITQKNKETNNMFKPLIKAFKHLRDTWPLSEANDAVSFHIECLLYRVPNSLFTASVSDTLVDALSWVANFSPSQAATSDITSPCGDKVVFSDNEWKEASYTRFNALVKQWASIAKLANEESDVNLAISHWKRLLGNDYFPRYV